jgi:hypothetical protein
MHLACGLSAQHLQQGVAVGLGEAGEHYICPRRYEGLHCRAAYAAGGANDEYFATAEIKAGLGHFAVLL